eukprot:363983-Chlamydomonas_euryale.AAC.2
MPRLTSSQESIQQGTVRGTRSITPRSYPGKEGKKTERHPPLHPEADGGDIRAESAAAAAAAAGTDRATERKARLRPPLPTEAIIQMGGGRMPLHTSPRFSPPPLLPQGVIS